jgi:hypothetical protein
MFRIIYYIYSMENKQEPLQNEEEVKKAQEAVQPNTDPIQPGRCPEGYIKDIHGNCVKDPGIG